jgi:hypothetical protein
MVWSSHVFQVDYTLWRKISCTTILIVPRRVAHPVAFRYFTRQGYQGVSIFRRRNTSDEGMRGARLGALGLLVGA